MADNEMGNECATPNEIELDISELKDVSGGAYDESTGECHCNGCGTLMEYKGETFDGRKVYLCPNCGRKAHVYY